MKKCNKVKNPCKICFDTVTKKTGLQCQGACQKWAHFKCLNYTPGKIQDIKAKIIKITCPCPDCDTSQPKEVLTDPPFTCTNSQCPANNLPVCASTECPSKENPIPTYPPPPFEYSPAPSPISSPKCQNKQTSPPPKRTLSPTQCNISPRISSTKKPKSSCSPCPSQVRKTVNKNFSPKQSQSCSDFSNNSNYSGKFFCKKKYIYIFVEST